MTRYQKASLMMISICIRTNGLMCLQINDLKLKLRELFNSHLKIQLDTCMTRLRSSWEYTGRMSASTIPYSQMSFYLIQTILSNIRCSTWSTKKICFLQSCPMWSISSYCELMQDRLDNICRPFQPKLYLNFICLFRLLLKMLLWLLKII